MATLRSLEFALGVAAVCLFLATPPPPAASAGSKNRTRVVLVSPVSENGTKTKKGYRQKVGSGDCVPGSLVTGNPTFVRCFVGNLGHDPCWAIKTPGLPGRAICLTAPWLKSVLVVTTRRFLPPTTPTGRIFLAGPWGVELTSGEHCGATGSMPYTYDGSQVDYYCTPSSLRLLDYPDRKSGIWTFRAVRQVGSTAHFVAAGIVRVRAAYYAHG
jgi:hypothetical protein